MQIYIPAIQSRLQWVSVQQEDSKHPYKEYNGLYEFSRLNRVQSNDQTFLSPKTYRKVIKIIINYGKQYIL